LRASIGIDGQSLTPSTPRPSIGKQFDHSEPAPSNFAPKRVIVMRHRGIVANMMFQYMGALMLANRIKHRTIFNVSIHEWGSEIPDDTQGSALFDNIDPWIWDRFRPPRRRIVGYGESQPQSEKCWYHLRRVEFLMRPESYGAQGLSFVPRAH
jgi:hypothetical protein